MNNGADETPARGKPNVQTKPNRRAKPRQDPSAQAEQRAPILGSLALLGRYFQEMFGTEAWGDAGEPPEYPSGPVPGSEGSLAQRRLHDPEARFWYSVMMSQVMLLPFCVAHDAAEKVLLNAEIAQIVGLDVAAKKGWIDGFVICWRHGRYPTSPTGIRVLSAEGRRTREQVLGSLEPHIRRFIKHAQAGPYDPVHVMNARRIG